MQERWIAGLCNDRILPRTGRFRATSKLNWLNFMIDTIEIDGFRLLNGFKADLNPLTVIIGANATGKSSLIESLQLISWCCEHSLTKVLGSNTDSILTFDNKTTELRWKLDFCKPKTSFWNELPLENDPLVYEVNLNFDKLGKVYPIREVLRSSNSESDESSSIRYLDSTLNQRQIFDKKSGKLISFDEVGGDKFATVEEPGAESAISGANVNVQQSMQESTLLLSKMQFPNEYPIPSAVRSLLSRMSFYPGFDVTQSSVMRTKAFELRAVTWLTPNGDNLGTVLHEILTRIEFKGVASDLQDYMRAAFPTFEEISVETTFHSKPQLVIRIMEKHAMRSTEVWELSDGMLRFMCLAAAMLNPFPPPLIAFDEPETGLHPGLMPVIADMIKEASERTQVLVTTHSPELLDCFDINNVAVMARDEGELKTVWHRPSDRTHLSRLLQGVAGTTLGDLHRSGELEAGA